jgi:hypothetical protein
MSKGVDGEQSSRDQQTSCSKCIWITDTSVLPSVSLTMASKRPLWPLSSDGESISGDMSQWVVRGKEGGGWDGERAGKVRTDPVSPCDRAANFWPDLLSRIE